jgi:hypothetical protein
MPLCACKSLELSDDDVVLSSGLHEEGDSLLVHGAAGDCLISDVSSLEEAVDIDGGETLSGTRGGGQIELT